MIIMLRIIFIHTTQKSKRPTPSPIIVHFQTAASDLHSHAISSRGHTHSSLDSLTFLIFLRASFILSLQLLQIIQSIQNDVLARLLDLTR